MPNDDEEVLQLSEVIIRRVQWSYKSLLERRGLKMLRFLEKFGKPPFPNLLVNRCVNDVTRVCRGRIEALPPTFTTHSSKTSRRIDFAWPAMRVISLGIRTVPVLSVAKKLAAPRPTPTAPAAKCGLIRQDEAD